MLKQAQTESTYVYRKIYLYMSEEEEGCSYFRSAGLKKRISG
jgi:hypothetical protein